MSFPLRKRASTFHCIKILHFNKLSVPCFGCHCKMECFMNNTFRCFCEIVFETQWLYMHHFNKVIVQKRSLKWKKIASLSQSLILVVLFYVLQGDVNCMQSAVNKWFCCSKITHETEGQNVLLESVSIKKSFELIWKKKMIL